MGLIEGWFYGVFERLFLLCSTDITILLLKPETPFQGASHKVFLIYFERFPKPILLLLVRKESPPESSWVGQNGHFQVMGSNNLCCQ